MSGQMIIQRFFIHMKINIEYCTLLKYYLWPLLIVHYKDFRGQVKK